MSITSSISHLIQGIWEFITGVFNAAGNLLQWALTLPIEIANFLLDAAKAVIVFITNNLLLVVAVIGAIFAYLVITQRQGKAPISEAVKGKKAS